MTLHAIQECPPGQHVVDGTGECIHCGKWISPFRPNVNLTDGELNRSGAQCRDAQPGNDRHQSQLPPLENKFHKGNGDDGKHYWLTPWDAPEFGALAAEFGPFDFDPCPHPKPEGFDGLSCEWGARNYVNPPFGSIPPPSGKGRKLGPTAWVKKAIAESRKGKLVVLVYPVDKWLLMLTKAILGDHAEIRNLGDVRWKATEDGSVGKGTGRHIACFILRPSLQPQT